MDKKLTLIKNRTNKNEAQPIKLTLLNSNGLNKASFIDWIRKVTLITAVKNKKSITVVTLNRPNAPVKNNSNVNRPMPIAASTVKDSSISYEMTKASLYEKKEK
jgi:hypothetical protein